MEAKVYISKEERARRGECPHCLFENKIKKLWVVYSTAVRQCRKCGAVVEIETDKILVKGEENA